MAKWPYGTSQWQALRKAKLQTEPLCEPCQHRGAITPANTVDHVRSMASGGAPFPPLDSLMSMCERCHNGKTNAIDKPGGSGVAFKGCGLDGLPVDRAHPFLDKGYTPSQDGEPTGRDRRDHRAITKFGNRKKRAPWD